MENWENKLKAQEELDAEAQKIKAEEEEARNSGRAQLLNLHEDAVLDRKIFLDLSKNPAAKVGRKNPSLSEKDQPLITLGGAGI